MDATRFWLNVYSNGELGCIALTRDVADFLRTKVTNLPVIYRIKVRLHTGG